ncbi:hypothetical protein LJ754_12210 [Arthrobacter sp. zg-Y40]|uniref:hypothetical protein n=1 Tax=Arthrobacter sp. zg-Y40 TaxID=2886939 RepID=UPI001D1530CD|nr:hypothetical protein [Arthrobacter sp. zg-Y40]MCC3279913.1 hypothetical protein [Arthrobacter sp. zg-Y40]
MSIQQKMILPLPRPQYVAVPEALISALAWRAYDVELDGEPIGLVYRADLGNKQPKTFTLRATEPGSNESLAKFGEALKDSGVKSQVAPEMLARAVLNSVVGVRAEKSGKQPATPITPGLALLQNMRGLQGAKNPPDLAEIMETMYGLGGGAKSARGSMTAQWLHATATRMEMDSLLRALDAAVDGSLLGEPRKDAREDPMDKTAARLAGSSVLAGTPYSWLARSWDTLTSRPWVEALPARVWVDWATTVLRLGVGMGFLWEAAWYETIARKLLRSEGPAKGQDLVDWLASEVGEVLPWKSSRSMTSVRDVAPVLSWRIHRGDKIRRLLADELKDYPASENLTQGWERLGSNGELRSDLTVALGSKEKGANNAWEAVKYALLTRDATGPSADYYGLLRSNGRYMTVDPGTEWIAVVASLACGIPGQESNVRDVMASLADLGMQPELNDLVALLERAGLARGSADADQAVIVQSAFSGGTK